MHPGEAPADYTGCQTVVVMGEMLTGGRNPRFAASDSEAWQKTASGAREAGCQVLLGVSGQASALEAGTSAAEPLLQALEDSGADGLYLDITQRQWTDAVHLTQLAEALHRAAPEKKLYVEADAPVRGELDPDYAGLAAAADRIVLRVPAVTDSAAAVPVCAMEPLENICYALSVLNDEVPAQKLSLLLTAAGQAWNAGSRRFSTVTGDTLEAMLEEGTTLLFRPLRLRLCGNGERGCLVSGWPGAGGPPAAAELLRRKRPVRQHAGGNADTGGIVSTAQAPNRGQSCRKRRGWPFILKFCGEKRKPPGKHQTGPACYSSSTSTNWKISSMEAPSTVEIS